MGTGKSQAQFLSFQDFLCFDSCVQNCQATHLVKPVTKGNLPAIYGEDVKKLSGISCQTAEFSPASALVLAVVFLCGELDSGIIQCNSVQTKFHAVKEFLDVCLSLPQTSFRNLLMQSQINVIIHRESALK